MQRFPACIHRPDALPVRWGRLWLLLGLLALPAPILTAADGGSLAPDAGTGLAPDAGGLAPDGGGGLAPDSGGLAPDAGDTSRGDDGLGGDAGGTGPLEVRFYFSPSCPKCVPTVNAVDAAEEGFGDKVRVLRRDITQKDIFREYLRWLDAYGITDETPKLIVFVGGKVLKNDDQIIPNLDATVAELLAARAKGEAEANNVPSVVNGEGGTSDSDRTQIVALVLSGLADGLNPCAFATVILFISMLTAVMQREIKQAGRGQEGASAEAVALTRKEIEQKSRRDMLAIGISFIIAVFVTYFVIGIAAFSAMKLLSHVKWMSLLITWGALLLAAVAGVLSLVDAYRSWKTEGKGEMLLVLPEGLKNRIHKVLRKAAHGGSLIAGGFVAGVIVSFLESACTGQVYFPIITMLVNNQETRMEGLAKLALYNTMFIIPLLLVFIGAYVGINNEKIANATRKHVWMTKLALAAIFLLLAALLAMDLLGISVLRPKGAKAPAPAVSRTEALSYMPRTV